MACLLETPIRMSVLSVSDPPQPLARAPARELRPSSQRSPQTRRAFWAPPLEVVFCSALGRGGSEGGWVGGRDSLDPGRARNGSKYGNAHRCRFSGQRAGRVGLRAAGPAARLGLCQAFPRAFLLAMPLLRGRALYSARRRARCWPGDERPPSPPRLSQNLVEGPWLPPSWGCQARSVWYLLLPSTRS